MQKMTRQELEQKQIELSRKAQQATRWSDEHRAILLEMSKLAKEYPQWWGGCYDGE